MISFQTPAEIQYNSTIATSGELAVSPSRPL
jgi:hypothetical protein